VRRVRRLLPTGLALALAACTATPEPPAVVAPAVAAPAPVAPSPATPTATSPGGTESASLLQVPSLPSADVSRYEARGRRDPFETLEVREGSEAPTVAAARLTGIVQGRSERLALVETAEGLGYILRRGDSLGESRVTEIGLDTVVFTVPPRPGVATNRIVLRLDSD
jgi:hypothetical protein